LLFCKNDINAINIAFIEGLKADPENIILCGITGSVLDTDLTYALKRLSAISEKDDTLLFYFSGHGGTINGDHHLILSNTMIKTQKLIADLETITAKNKILFLDCCMAGNFTVDGTAIFGTNETINEFAGKGYAVIASSNAIQYSYRHPNKPVSLFTSFLFESLINTSTIREGKKSLYDIQKLLFLYLEVWNKHNPSMKQSPIYRANMGGTVFFEVQEYKPYPIEQYFEETEKYIIYSVEPTHSSIAKRYSVKVILKRPFSFVEISCINHEIVEKVKLLNIYHNERQGQYWYGKSANLIFCYFGLDNTDIINCNYICHTTWADNTQDKDWWYRLNKNCEIINDIHFNIHLYYQTLRIFTEKHTGTKENLIAETRCIMSKIITLAEKVIFKYNEFLNGVKSEQRFIDDMTILIPRIETLYFAESNLDIPSEELKEWCQCCTGLSSTVHDFTLFYNPKYLSGRTSQNRKACMDLSIKQYYKDLEHLKIIDTNISD
jgi:Uncharacterized protein containing caspase domain